MKANPAKKYYRLALLLTLLISFTIHFQLLLAIVFEDADKHHGEPIGLGFASLELFFTLCLSFLLFILNYYIVKPLIRHKKLNTFIVLTSIFSSFFVTHLLVHIFNYFKFEVGLQVYTPHFHNETLFRNMFSTALVLGSVYIFRLINQKQSFELENEMLKSESIKLQFESLKNQISPHFLFNTLTALNSLVTESPELAGEYINHLARVLRYTLQGNDKKMVKLSEEMDFNESYLFLLKKRYGNNLVVEININESLMSFELPPLSIQTLIENAVKHNEISVRKPLKIAIQTSENNELIVSNNINKKLTPEEGTGIGLTNLSKQFQLLGEKEIQIIDQNNEFKVILPLINTTV